MIVSAQSDKYALIIVQSLAIVTTQHCANQVSYNYASFSLFCMCTAFKIEPIADADDNDAYINHSNYESEKSHNDCEYHDKVTAGVSVSQPIKESRRQVQNGVD